MRPRYDVEVDNEGDGVGGNVKTRQTTTYVWPDPQGVGEQTLPEDFYVRVRAHFDNNLQTSWSDYVRYDVTQLTPSRPPRARPGSSARPSPTPTPTCGPA